MYELLQAERETSFVLLHHVKQNHTIVISTSRKKGIKCKFLKKKYILMGLVPYMVKE